MKKIVLSLCIFVFFINHWYATDLQNPKQALIESKIWTTQLLKKIDQIVILIEKKNKQNPNFKKNFSKKIQELKTKLKKSNSQKSKNMYLILDYLDYKTNTSTQVSSSTYSKRVNSILSNKKKQNANSRTNKIKTLKYKKQQIRK